MATKFVISIAAAVLATTMIVSVASANPRSAQGIKSTGVYSHPAGEASAAAWRNCGIANCTDYMTRSETVAKANFLAAHGNVMYDLTHKSCTAIEVMALVVDPNVLSFALGRLGCYVVTQRLASMMRTVQQAAATGGCFAISYLRYGSNNPFFATGWSAVYGSYWCRP